MLAQSLLVIIISGLIIWIGIVFIVKPFLQRHDIKLESLIKKKDELLVKKAELESKLEEADVTNALLLVEEEIKRCDEEITATEKQRKKKK